MTNQGRNEQVYNTSENNDQNEDISYISNGVEETIHFSSTTSSSSSVHVTIPREESLYVQINCPPFSSPSNITQNIGEISSQQSTNHNANNFQRNDIDQGNTIFAPQARRGAFYLRSLLNYHHSTEIVDLPYASLARNNDSELMIEIETIMERIHIDQLLRLQQQRSHIQTERGLTEDEIMKCISCRNFDGTIEGTSENKELCCICQEEYLTGEEIGKLDCAHIFHVNCIKQWLAEKNICPLCNRRGLFVVDDVIDGC